MLEVVTRFIRAYHYDFPDENTGALIQGNTMLCYDELSDSLIKVSIDNLESIKARYSFGDVVTLTAVPNGRFLRYSYDA